MARKTTKKKATPNTMWGGRYALGPAEIMEKINASIGFDRKLYAQDIAGSAAHADMLVAQGILTAKDGRAIKQGLAQVKAEIEQGKFKFSTKLEDIHFNVEQRLTDLIGPAGGRLHTARSRNDQVALDVRLWTRDTVDRLEAMLRDLQMALIDRAEEYAATIMPGFTHLQTAQPITFGHHLLAYVEMFGRDRSRLRDCRARMNESPLGAAALAGTPHPIDRHSTAKALGFDRPMANSLDAVSDRDYLTGLCYAAALAMVHLSRIGEELVLWTSAEYGFAELDDSAATGSSMMPQKKNPDAAELVRGKAGTAIGRLAGLLSTLKGLPLAYNRDLQEDKRASFDQVDDLAGSLAALTVCVRGLRFDRERMAAAAGDGRTVATDRAERLVREGVPFREAHARVAERVAAGERFAEPTAEQAAAGRLAPDDLRAQLAEARAAVAGL